MKLENRGYRLNQRLNYGIIYGRFEWKIRLQLSQSYCYNTGISRFSNILIVIITKAGPHKFHTTIILEFRQGINFCY